jgi:hypothetical protein
MLNAFSSGQVSTLPLENVRFEVAHIKVSENTSDVKITWPEDASTDAGKLSPQRFNQGGTKHVHNVCITVSACVVWH